MNIIADTTLLLRLLIPGGEGYSAAVHDLLENSEEIVIPTAVFCELVVVLREVCQLERPTVIETIEGILNSRKVKACEDEVSAGLQMLKDGGDFAAGVAAYSGRMMASGQAVFATFDQNMMFLLAQQGQAALVPAIINNKEIKS